MVRLDLRYSTYFIANDLWIPFKCPIELFHVSVLKVSHYLHPNDIFEYILLFTMY